MVFFGLSEGHRK